MTLTEAQCLALAQVLNRLPDNVAAAHIISTEQWDVYMEAREQISNAADEIIHASRAGRRG